MAGVASAASIGLLLGLLLGSSDNASPSLVMVGKRQEAGREVVEFRVDVPWRRPAFLHPEGAEVRLQHGKQKPNWGSQPPVFQAFFTNTSPKFGVLAPADSSVWRLHLIVIVEASATRRAVKNVERCLKTGRFAWGGYAPTTHWLLSELITNAVPPTADAPRP